MRARNLYQQYFRIVYIMITYYLSLLIQANLLHTKSTSLTYYLLKTFDDEDNGLLLLLLLLLLEVVVVVVVVVII